MKIFYTGIRHEGYDPKRRDSFEYVNFYLTLKHMAGVDPVRNSPPRSPSGARLRAGVISNGMEVIEYPFDHILDIGKKKFNDELLEIVKREKPDILFAFMYTDELDPAVLQQIKKTTGTKTIAWFADDYWRFWNYSRHWAPYFSYVVTTSPQAVGWYHAAGHTNVIESQWACNTKLYLPPPTSDLQPTHDIDISFVGQYKPARAKIIDALRAKGIAVEAYGFGWSKGKLSHDGMISVFSRSKINLNLNVRPSLFEPRVLARLFLKKSVDRLVPDFHLIDNFRAWRHFAVPHTHARPFELAGCRAFTISGLSEGIERFYEPDREMVFYKNTDDLAQKIRYYLSHNEEREKIAQAGYERTLRDHTYEKRFNELFAKVLNPSAKGGSASGGKP